MWLASTWTRPSGRWCSASTRRRAVPGPRPHPAEPADAAGTRGHAHPFKLIDLHVPRELDIHVVLDNLSAHRAPEINTWLAHPKRARWHLHFTPTSSSWLKLVEGWFKLLTERRLRHGVFSSVETLGEPIELWAEHWNDDPKPFVWRKTAEEIIEKVRRGRAALHQVHATPHH